MIGNKHGREGSLFWLLNRCKSPFGKRCLKEATTPFIDIKDIQERQIVVKWLCDSKLDDRCAWLKHTISLLGILLRLTASSRLTS